MNSWNQHSDANLIIVVAKSLGTWANIWILILSNIIKAHLLPTVAIKCSNTSPTRLLWDAPIALPWVASSLDVWCSFDFGKTKELERFLATSNYLNFAAQERCRKKSLFPNHPPFVPNRHHSSCILKKISVRINLSHKSRNARPGCCPASYFLVPWCFSNNIASASVPSRFSSVSHRNLSAFLFPRGLFLSLLYMRLSMTFSATWLDHK